MRKFVILDAFCGAGGTTRGYQQAGFRVVGVDINPQEKYIGDDFVQADALEYIAQHGHEYDAFHASPPCQFASVLKSIWVGRSDYSERHLNLIEPTRDLLLSLGKPYVIENVPGAREFLRNPIMLCGAHFGLKVYRHRLFECNFPIAAPPHVSHKDGTPRSGRGKSPKGFITVTGNGGVAANHGSSALGMPYLAYASMAMGIDWTNRKELAQAIPPAYTRYIGEFLMKHLRARKPTLLESLFRQVAAYA